MSNPVAIPQLDLGRFDAGEAARAAFLDDLRVATRDVGFFYLTGHGIAPGLLSELLEVARGFFALPEAEKQAIEMVHSPHFRGYNRVASELTRGIPDWREQIDRFSWVRGWTPPCRCCNYPPRWPRRPTAPTATRTIRCCGMSDKTISRDGCAHTLTWPGATTPT